MHGNDSIVCTASQPQSSDASYVHDQQIALRWPFEEMIGDKLLDRSKPLDGCLLSDH
jgi:hypothetical protein